MKLEVPFEKKDEFKAKCRQANIKYEWNTDGDKKWSVDLEGNDPPSWLEEYKAPTSSNRTGPERSYVIDCDYSYYPFASRVGAKWDKEKKVAVFKGSSLPLELTGFEPKRWSWAEKTQRELNKEKLLPQKGSKQITLHKHQNEAVKLLLDATRRGSPGYLIADETGLGKTLEVWAAIREMEKSRRRPLRILITGPLNSLEAWREAITWLGTGAETEGNDILLMNYERLKHLFKDSEKKAKTQKGLAKFGEAPEFDILVCDESHYLKNPAAARTKLVRALEKKAGFTIWVSATAGQNPLELTYLSRLLASEARENPSEIEKNFEQWCKSKGIGLRRGDYGKWIWEANEEDNAILHKLLFGGARKAIRRRCKDIAGWPELQRIPLRVELSSGERKAYETEWQEFLKALQEDRLNRLDGKKDISKGLARLTRLRQKASLLRVERTAELAEELIENNHQVAIAVEYLATADAISEALKKKKYRVSEYTGRNAANREDERKAYQQGDRDAIIFSVESSLSLHQEKETDKKRAQINHDLRWSGIEQEQVDGRSHRNGMHAPVYWCFSQDTVEERVATVLLGKLESMNTLRGDDTSFQAIYKEVTRI